MILTQHGMNSIDLGGGGGGDTVEIGGKVYRAVQMPDGNIWLGENLDYQFPGCVIGASGDSDTEPRGNYYDNDEELWGWNGRKCGLLYNYPAVQYMNDHCDTLFPGWHVATNTEWNDLDGGDFLAVITATVRFMEEASMRSSGQGRKVITRR